MIDIIKELTKKNPQFQKHIINVILKNDNNFNTNILKEFISDFTLYKNILKNNSYDFFSYNTLEKAYDELNEIVTTNKAKKIIKEEISNKNKHLVNEKTIHIIRDAIIDGFDLNIFKNEIFRKISKYRTANTLNNSLLKTIENNSKTLNKLINDIQESKSDIIKVDRENKIVIARINNYKDSNFFGSRSWCISTSKNFWDSYVNKRAIKSSYSVGTNQYLLKKKKTNNLNNQFFLWNQKESNKKSMIGFTYDNSLNKIAAHYKDDSICPEQIFKYISKKELFSKINGFELLEGRELVKDIKIVTPKVSEISIFYIILDICPSYYKEYYKKNIGKISRKKNIELYEDKIFKSSELYKTDNLELALTHWSKSDEVQLHYLKNIKKVIKEYDISYFERQIDSIFSHQKPTFKSKEDFIKIIKNAHLESLSTLPIENHSIKKRVEEYMEGRDLSCPENINGVLVKTIQRAIKNNDLDWLEGILDGRDISMKLLSYSSIITKIEAFFNNTKCSFVGGGKISDVVISNLSKNIEEYYFKKRKTLKKEDFSFLSKTINITKFISNQSKREYHINIMKSFQALYSSNNTKKLIQEKQIPNELNKKINEYSLEIKAYSWKKTIERNQSFTEKDFDSLMKDDELLKKVVSYIKDDPKVKLILSIYLRNNQIQEKENKISKKIKNKII